MRGPGSARHANTNWTGMGRDRCIWGESKRVVLGPLGGLGPLMSGMW